MPGLDRGEPVRVRRLYRDPLRPRVAAATREQRHEGEQRDSVTEMLALAAALALVPTPIGVGPGYHPAPAAHGHCVPAALHGAARVHVELFANRRVVIVPAAIGLRSARIR